MIILLAYYCVLFSRSSNYLCGMCIYMVRSSLSGCVPIYFDCLYKQRHFVCHGISYISFLLNTMTTCQSQWTVPNSYLVRYLVFQSPTMRHGDCVVVMVVFVVVVAVWGRMSGRVCAGHCWMWRTRVSIVARSHASNGGVDYCYSNPSRWRNKTAMMMMMTTPCWEHRIVDGDSRRRWRSWVICPAWWCSLASIGVRVSVDKRAVDGMWCDEVTHTQLSYSYLM